MLVYSESFEQGIHVTQMLLSPLSPSFTTWQIWESVTVSDFPHTCPAICSRLLVSPMALQGSKANIALTNNKEPATASSHEPDSQPSKIIWCLDNENAQGFVVWLLSLELYDFWGYPIFSQQPFRSKYSSHGGSKASHWSLPLTQHI